MKRLTALLVVAALAAGSTASAAGPDPKALVLQRADVPSGFTPERGHGATGYVTNSAVASGDPAYWRRVAGTGRISGYTATYENGAKAIASAVHLFRSSGGAHALFTVAKDQQRALNAERVRRRARPYRHGPISLGDEATLNWSTQRPTVKLILWRSGRAVAALTTWGMRRDVTLALARAQQHRIEKTLR